MMRHKQSNERFEYAVDFKGVNSRASMYTVILDSLDFPEWCGVTLDSIWDCLTDMLMRVTIILDNFDCTVKLKLYSIFNKWEICIFAYLLLLYNNINSMFFPKNCAFICLLC